MFRTAPLGQGDSELESGLNPANHMEGDQSAYVGDESAARTLADPRIGPYENWYTRFDMHPDFESEFAPYRSSYPEGGPDSYQYQIPADLIPRFNDLTLGRTAVQW